MAIGDFTGQNIQDTYQRVVQTDNTNRLADGEGNIFIPISASHAITASHALFAVSASHEVTFELSSSHAVSADTASFATNFTSSGNISASGNLEISSSLTFGDGIAQIIGPGNNDYLQLATDQVDIFINGSSYVNVDPDSIILNSSNKAVNTSIKADDTTALFFGDATNNAVRLKDHIIMSPGAPVDYTNTLLVSGSTHFTGSNSHITASGNISASGTISASRFNGSGGDLTDVSYNNLAFVPSGIISGAAQINNLDLTINGGTF